MVPPRLQVIKKCRAQLLSTAFLFLNFFEHGSKIRDAFRDYLIRNAEFRIGFRYSDYGIDDYFIHTLYFVFLKLSAEAIYNRRVVHEFLAEILGYGFGNFIRKAGANKKPEFCFKKFVFMFFKKSRDLFIYHSHPYVRAYNDAFVSGKIGNIF